MDNIDWNIGDNQETNPANTILDFIPFASSGQCKHNPPINTQVVHAQSHNSFSSTRKVSFESRPTVIAFPKEDGPPDEDSHLPEKTDKFPTKPVVFKNFYANISSFSVPAQAYLTSAICKDYSILALVETHKQNTVETAFRQVNRTSYLNKPEETVGLKGQAGTHGGEVLAPKTI